MKKISLFVSIICLSLTVNAQITLENTYTDAHLKVARLDDTTTIYYATNKTEMVLYNANHSVYKNIPYPSEFTKEDSTMVYYVSRTLFDKDDEIEYMTLNFVVGQNGEPRSKGFMRVYDEDGTVLLAEDTLLFSKFSYLFGIAPMIVNTEEGTKLIVRKGGPGWKGTKIYGLNGKLYLATEVIGGNNMNIGSAYPNPTREFTKIDYVLPDGIRYGEIEIFDLNGHLVKTYVVDGAFKNLLLSVRDLSPGSYYYRLKTSLGVGGGKQMVVIQ